MKALKDCEWRVKINDHDSYYQFSAIIIDKDCGLEDYEVYKNFGGERKDTYRKALNNWKKFAKVNDITKYFPR